MWTALEVSRNNNAAWVLNEYEKFLPKTAKRKGKMQVFLDEVLHENNAWQQ